jgi:hypothetical protein
MKKAAASCRGEMAWVAMARTAQRWAESKFRLRNSANAFPKRTQGTCQAGSVAVAA